MERLAGKAVYLYYAVRNGKRVPVNSPALNFINATANTANNNTANTNNDVPDNGAPDNDAPSSPIPNDGDQTRIYLDQANSMLFSLYHARSDIQRLSYIPSEDAEELVQDIRRVVQRYEDLKNQVLEERERERKGGDPGIQAKSKCV
ncbi:hypothetical protein [Absidia glauca]|uniref:Uncharacterized protein n=1 Tax=Absidia glauca TaxID=4829 RepID=A0A163IZR9_ABSGL|nr:hypothetical protein [Absidia glauca]